MKNTELAALALIANTQFEASQTRLAAILLEEKKIRGLLADLNRNVTAGRQALQEDASYRTIRGDQAWSNWVGRNRQALNLRLAKLLVRKESALSDAQKTFGKADVLNTLTADQTRQSRMRTERADLDALLAPLLMR